MQGCAQNPNRPFDVPASAAKVDGAFIQCSVETASLANRCTVYKDTTGDVLISGLFVLSGAGREATSADLKYAAFDGTRIYLEDARALYPVLLDEGSAMQERLRLLAGEGAIRCGRVGSGRKPEDEFDCARTALTSKKPFYVYYFLQTGNSIVADGFVGDPKGGLYEVRYYNIRISPLVLPQGAQLSDGGYILTYYCPNSVKVWDSHGGNLPCFPRRE